MPAEIHSLSENVSRETFDSEQQPELPFVGQAQYHSLLYAGRDFMLDKEEIVCLLKEAAFGIDEYWVTSGAAMVLYGIRDTTRDIDLGCTSQMADRLESTGYSVEILRDGSRKIVFSETIEIFENWIEDKAILLNGLPVISLEGMIMMKEKLGREKDRKDIRLIEDFINRIHRRGMLDGQGGPSCKAKNRGNT